MDRSCKHLPSCKTRDATKIYAMRSQKRNQPMNGNGLHALSIHIFVRIFDAQIYV